MITIVVVKDAKRLLRSGDASPFMFARLAALVNPGMSLTLMIDPLAILLGFRVSDVLGGVYPLKLWRQVVHVCDDLVRPPPAPPPPPSPTAFAWRLPRKESIAG